MHPLVGILRCLFGLHLLQKQSEHVRFLVLLRLEREFLLFLLIMLLVLLFINFCLLYGYHVALVVIMLLTLNILLHLCLIMHVTVHLSIRW